MLYYGNQFLECQHFGRGNFCALMYQIWCKSVHRGFSKNDWTVSDLLWPPCRIGHAIIFSSCGFSFFLSIFLLSFFPRSFSAVADWMFTVLFHTWCGLSANLGRRSETCCTRLAENTGCIKSPKIRHLRTIAQLYRAISSQRRDLSTIGKNLLNSNISPTCPHNMVNFGLLAAEIGLLVWGTQQISTGFASWLRYCSDVTQRKPTKLCTMFGRLLGWYTIHWTIKNVTFYFWL